MNSQSYQLSFEPFIENRRSYLLLRWLVIVLASYLVLFGRFGQEDFYLASIVVAAFAASNIIAGLLPLRAFLEARKRHYLTAADAIFISACIYILRVESPLIHIPFIAIFLMALIWNDLRVVLFSLLVVSVLYGAFSYFRMFGVGTVVAIDQFLALALFFDVAVFYTFLVDRLDREATTSTAMIEEKRNSEIMVEITRILSGSMNPKEIYRVIVSRLSEALDGAEFLIARVEGDEAIILASSSNEIIGPRAVPLAAEPALRLAHETKRTTSAKAPGPSGRDYFRLAIPMMTQGEVLGLVYLRGGRLDLEPSSTTIHLIEVVASTAANALRNVQLFEEMKHMARTDFLTGLPNHRYFQLALAREMGRALRHDHPLSLLVLDLDLLKRVNDQFGHPAGDSVIRSVAATIRSTCREIDFAARYGGEEFVVILPETDLPGAIEAAERLRRRIEDTDVGDVGRITASVGVANYPVNAASKEYLIRVADQALYVAKNGGRNQVAHFNYQLTNK